GLEAIAGVEDCAFFADAGEHIGERLAFRVMEDCVARGNDRSTRCNAEGHQLAEAAALVAAIAIDRGEIGPPTRSNRKRSEPLAEAKRHLGGRQSEEDLAFARRDDVVECEVTLALPRTPVAVREQLAQPAVGLPLLGVSDDLEAVRGDEACADEE